MGIKKDDLVLDTDLMGLRYQDVPESVAPGHDPTTLLFERLNLDRRQRQNMSDQAVMTWYAEVDEFLFGSDTTLELWIDPGSHTMAVIEMNTSRAIAGTAIDDMTWEQLVNWCRMVAALNTG